MGNKLTDKAKFGFNGSINFYMSTNLFAFYSMISRVQSCFQARTWLATIGFTMLFGALFSKTYRIYVIFREKTAKKKVIHYIWYCITGVIVNMYRHKRKVNRKSRQKYTTAQTHAPKHVLQHAFTHVSAHVRRSGHHTQYLLVFAGNCVSTWC